MSKYLSEIINQARSERTLGKLLNRDQSYNAEPAKREKLQNRLAKVFNNPENRESLFRPSKAGITGRHSAWVLAQHMDSQPETQKKVLDTMRTYDPSNKRGDFLKDRIDVNNAAKTEFEKNPQKYSQYGKDSKEAIRNMRPGREEFKGKLAPKSASDALSLEKKYNNNLLSKSIETADAARSDKTTRAFTQPSFATRWDDLPKTPTQSTLSRVAGTVGKAVGSVARFASNPVVSGISMAMEPTPAGEKKSEFDRQDTLKKFNPYTPSGRSISQIEKDINKPAETRKP